MHELTALIALQEERARVHALTEENTQLRTTLFIVLMRANRLQQTLRSALGESEAYVTELRTVMANELALREQMQVVEGSRCTRG